MAKRLLQILSLLALVGLTAAAFASTPRPPRSDFGQVFVPRPELAKATALGFDALLADYYWIQAVQIVGAADRVEDHAPLLGRLIDVVTTLDPWVDHPYRFAAVWLVDSEESVRTANRLLERGVEHHPDEWRNRFYLGFNHFFYLGDEVRASEILEPAIHLPGAPLYLSRLVARLAAGDGELETAATFLQQLHQETPDPHARAEYEKALDEIETERRARVLDAARTEFQRRHGRDIETVEELASGPGAVLPALPPELHDWEWVIDEETGRIMSSYYRYRYELQMHPIDRKRREEWTRAREARS